MHYTETRFAQHCALAVSIGDCKMYVSIGVSICTMQNVSPQSLTQGLLIGKLSIGGLRV